MIRIVILIILLTLPFFTKGKSIPINPSDSVGLQEKIHAKIDEVVSSGKLTDQLSEDDLTNLPIGIVSEVGGVQYVIVVDSVRFTPEAAFMNLYASLTFGESGKRLAFAATDILFQPGGLSASVSTKLRLVSRSEIPFGSKISLVLPADGSNNVEFDCNGFKSVNVKGLVEFDRDIIIPADQKLDKVTATIEGNFTDFNNIIAGINITPFKPAKYNEMVVNVEQAYVDFSDLVNPTSLVFPKGYNDPLSNPVLWRGFYIQKAKVTLPRKLNPGKGDIRINAKDLVIDKKGFSGLIGAANLFGTEEGNLNGWPFSIDSMGVHLIKNQLVGGSLRGEVVVPPFDKESPLKYTAVIQIGLDDKPSYIFNLQPTETLKASVLMADIELLKGSSITIQEVDGQFKPEAKLNGFMSVKSGDKLAIKKLQFQGLHLHSEKPYIRSGTWSITGEEQSLGSFPIAIQKVGLTHANDELKLSFDVMLNLMNAGSQGFAASTSVVVEGEVQEIVKTEGEYTSTTQKWKHTRTRIAAASIDFESKAISIYGKVNFYEKEATFGDGFRGEIDAAFAGGRYKFKAIGQFGKVDGYKYWYVDALMNFSPALGNGFGLYGLGGGAYYHMQKEESSITDYNNFLTVEGNKDSLMVGGSRSGTKYTPNKNIGLGFKASVVVGIIPTAKAFNGMATLEMSFFDGGGIKEIKFLGQGYFMKGIDESADNAQMYAELYISLDFENDVLHGQLDTYLNIRNIIVGTQADGLVGTAVLHIDKQDWYLHVGTPSRRMGINVANLAELKSYFMVGTVIEDFPALSDVIKDQSLIAGIKDDANEFMRDENALSTGGGIAFGASLTMSTGRKTFLMFYGQFEAGLGFDIMLRDYLDAQCKGSNDPIGINGWYASGQAWIYLKGEIGISVKLKFIKGDFVIMSVGVAAIVQAKLPNPTYVVGYVAGRYNILGGLVKGDFNFKLEIGEECEIVGGDVFDIEVIAGIEPVTQDAVDVFTAPQVAFNVPVNTLFEIPDLQTDALRAYKVELDHFVVKRGSKSLVGEIEFSDDKKVAVFNSFEILPPNSNLKIDVKVSWHERINGEWKSIGGANPEYEQKSQTFRTGEAPDHIPEHNVLYNYPVTGMYNFYPDEHNMGYMELKRGQGDLFKDTENNNFVARFEEVGSSEVIEVPLKYYKDKKSLDFSFPSRFTREKAYALLFVKVPKEKIKIDENVIQIEKDLLASNIMDKELLTSDTNKLIITKQRIEEAMLMAEEETLYRTHFATSRYNSFNEKMASLGPETDIIKYIPAWHVSTLGLLFYPYEGFDILETEGNSKIKPLIRFEAHQNEHWYLKSLYPLVYRNYPINEKFVINWEDRGDIMIPPLDAFSIFHNKEPIEFDYENLYNERIKNDKRPVVFYYELAYIGMRDFLSIQKSIHNEYPDLSDAPGITTWILNGDFENYVLGHYIFKARYILPGLNIVTSEIELSIEKK